MASHYLNYIKSIQPEGPYQLGGWSQGGIVALEIAQQLLANHEEITTLYFLDTFLYNHFERQQFKDPKAIQNFLNNDPYYQAIPASFREHIQAAEKIQTLAMLNYECQPYRGRIVLLKATQPWGFLDNPAFGWSWLSRQFMHQAFSKKHNGWSKLLTELTIYPIDGDHQSIMKGEAARAMAAHIVSDLNRHQRCQYTEQSRMFRRVIPLEQNQQQKGTLEQKI